MEGLGALCFAFLLLVQFCDMEMPKAPLRIGVILDRQSRHEKALSFAWTHYQRLGSARHDPMMMVDISNSHDVISKMCTKTADGAIIMIVENHPNTFGSVQSYAHYLSVPTIVPSGSGNSPEDPYKYDISLLPPTIEAIISVVQYFQWNVEDNVVYYLWDTNDALHRLQRFYDAFNTSRGNAPIIRARRIINVSDCYEILRKIDHQDPPPKRVVLDLSSNEAFKTVLHQIVDVGMNRDGYHYILGGLGINELDLGMFVYGGVNITGFSIIDRVTMENAELIKDVEQYRQLHDIENITTEVALVIDTVHVVLEAVKVLNEQQWNESNQITYDDDIYSSRSRGRHRVYRAGGNQTDKKPCCHCILTPLQESYDGKFVLKQLKQVETYGLTGNIEFDENGTRTGYVLYVHHLEHKKDLRKVGIWASNTGFNTSLPPLKPLQPRDTFQNRTLRIVTLMEQPFVQEKRSVDKSGAPVVNGLALEFPPRIGKIPISTFIKQKKPKQPGYCIDFAKKLQEHSQTPFEYRIDLVGDDSYGASYPNKGCWDGMVGELIDEVGCPNGGTRKKGDIVIAPLTITEERQRVVDFTKPFMQTGISIMIKKPDKEKPGVFSFMYPLSNRVWACVMVAFVAVSLVLFLVGRWSPYEWSDEQVKGEPINNFTLFNTFWFSLGALMQQGSDTFPRSYSGRIVGSAWWFFTLILISSYTANLAAFLTIERLLPPIKSVDDLVNQNKIAYGTLAKGSSKRFFEEAYVDVYRRMWQYMKLNADKVLCGDIMEGVEKVRSSKGDYAFMMESAMNKFHNQRKPCNTMKVGKNLDTKGYGVATPMGSIMRNPLNLAVLKLQEIGELMKLEQKWWYAKGECGTDQKDATTSALTLSNVSGIFHILVGGLVLAMVVALCEYLVHNRLRKMRRKNMENKMRSQTVRIVKKQTLEALKEVGYNDRETSAFIDPPAQFNSAPISSPLVTFDSGTYSQHPTPEHYNTSHR